jgi:hypothetical protein
MRAEEILLLLDDAGIGDSFDHHFPGGGALRHIQLLRKRLEAIEGIPGFEAAFRTFEKSIIFRTAQDSLDIQNGECAELRQMTQTCAAHLLGLRRYLKAVTSKQGKESLFFRMPETNDLRKLIADLDSISKCLSQSVTHPKVGGQVTVKSWEPGSFWIEIGVGSFEAIKLFAGLAVVAALALDQIQKFRIANEHISTLRIRQEQLEMLKDAQEQALRQLIDEEVEKTTPLFGDGGLDNETKERLKYTVRMLQEMFERGLKIRPALNAPEGVASPFENLQKLLLSGRKQDLLNNSSQLEKAS